MTCPKSHTAFYNISLNQGSSYTLPIVLKDGEGQAIDLTGFSAAMQVRIVPEAEEYIDELTTENGRIVIFAEAGRLELSFPHEVTEKYPAGQFFYDIEIASAGDEVTRVLQGRLLVNAEVTRVSTES